MTEFKEYAEKPKVDFPSLIFTCNAFKPSGKWYTTFYLVTTAIGKVDTYDVIESLRDYMSTRTHYRDMYITVDCEDAFPIMFKPLNEDVHIPDGYTPSDLSMEVVTRPIVDWIRSNYSKDLTCPVCREVITPNIFNNFCPNCGSNMQKNRRS